MNEHPSRDDFEESLRLVSTVLYLVCIVLVIAVIFYLRAILGNPEPQPRELIAVIVFLLIVIFGLIVVYYMINSDFDREYPHGNDDWMRMMMMKVVMDHTTGQTMTIAPNATMILNNTLSNEEKKLKWYIFWLGIALFYASILSFIVWRVLH
jgi:hypothetical protein